MKLDFTNNIKLERLLMLAKGNKTKDICAVLEITSGGVTLLRMKTVQPRMMEIIGVDYEPAGTDISAAVKQLLKRNSAVKEVVVSLSSLEVKIYNFSLPALSEYELMEAVKWKVKQIRPFNLNPEDLFYKIIGHNDLTGNKIISSHKILLVVVPKSAVMRITGWIDELGCRVSAVTMGAFGLMRFKQLKRLPVDEVFIWLFLDVDESFMVIEFGGLPIFIKSLAVKSSAIAKQIAGAFKITDTQAIDLCRECGLAYWDENKKMSDYSLSQEKQVKTSFNIASILENLVVEIEHTIKQFSYQVTDLPQCSRAAIAGEITDWKKIKEFLNLRLGMPVEKIDMFEFVKRDDSLGAKQPAGFGSLILSSGICMQAAAEIIPVNLYTAPATGFLSVINKYVRPINIIGVFAGILLIVGVCNFIKVIGFRAEVEELKKETKQIEQRLNSAQTEIMSLSKQSAGLINQKNFLQNKQNFLANTLHKAKSSALIAALAVFLPEGVSISKVAYEDNKITLVGNTLDASKVMKFLDALRDKGNFSNVQLKYMLKPRKGELYEFETIIDTIK